MRLRKNMLDEADVILLAKKILVVGIKYSEGMGVPFIIFAGNYKRMVEGTKEYREKSYENPHLCRILYSHCELFEHGFFAPVPTEYCQGVYQALDAVLLRKNKG